MFDFVFNSFFHRCIELPRNWRQVDVRSRSKDVMIEQVPTDEETPAALFIFTESFPKDAFFARLTACMPARVDTERFGNHFFAHNIAAYT